MKFYSVLKYKLYFQFYDLGCLKNKSINVHVLQKNFIGYFNYSKKNELVVPLHKRK